ncbi:MAG TPA: hypothetical protein PK878_16820 [bacterium]|nr:hypothetical protein [bacterium]HOL96166.1 hypothetical protein [bacterium]HPP00962.1 hypothetical protein [bacterium]
MITPTRRHFIKTATTGIVAAGWSLANQPVLAQIPGERPEPVNSVKVINPRARVPLSFIIDDSTCLVNLAHFAIPQFAEVFPDQYKQPWKSLPREIPDAFVRKFADWCRDAGVKGKFSVVPYPACVGWLDRDLPGWSKRELLDSLHLVRTELPSHWDFHPEMVSHTWVIDTKTGRSYPDRTENFMENWGWSAGKSVDQLADYLAYALRILKNVDIPCEGITTPGGFGSRARPELAQATLEACRDVFQTEIPHYFRDLFTDETSVAPRVEYASGLNGPDPKCVVSIIGCTGDWFGGWDGLTPGSVDLLITRDLEGGRMPEVIRRGEPAIMVCHWPGIYFNGLEIGFNILKEAVKRLHEAYDNLVWMKLSEIARYWAAKELTRITRNGNEIHFQAPYACPEFTVAVTISSPQVPQLHIQKQPVELKEASHALRLTRSTWTRRENEVLVCFDLPKGESTLTLV